jgi:outer membrane receptor for ferrienterochelin and colicin
MLDAAAHLVAAVRRRMAPRGSWKLNMYQGTRLAPIGDVTQKRTSDDLASANLTFSLSDRQNLRFAFYNTVARPDPREVSADYYIAVTGDCGNRGNPNLNTSKILNGDVRWEFYTRPGELLSVSAFYKDFTDPIAELLSFPGSSECTTEYFNLESAKILGGELEVPRTLDFLPGALERIALGLNLTVVDSRAIQRVDPTITREFALQGQSDILANLNLLYADAEGLDERAAQLLQRPHRAVRDREHQRRRAERGAERDGAGTREPRCEDPARRSAGARCRCRHAT